MKVLFFARVRDLAGAAETMLDLGPAATVADLRQALGNRYPTLTALLDRCAVAVDGEVADASTPVSPTAVVALLPPVSGG